MNWIGRITRFVTEPDIGGPVEQYVRAWVSIRELGDDERSEFGPMYVFGTRNHYKGMRPTSASNEPGVFTTGPIPGDSPIDYHVHEMFPLSSTGGTNGYRVGDIVLVGQVGHIPENLCIFGNLSFYQRGSDCCSPCG